MPGGGSCRASKVWPIDCRNAEGREVGGRHEANGDFFSLAVCDAGLGALQVALRRHHRRERAVLILQLAEFRVREERPFASLRTYRHAARFGVRQNDDLVRIPDGQRAHQHAAHEAEDRRVRANPQGQRQHGNDGEAGVRRKDADGVSKVLCDHVLMLPKAVGNRSTRASAQTYSTSDIVAIKRVTPTKPSQEERRRNKTIEANQNKSLVWFLPPPLLL